MVIVIGCFNKKTLVIHCLIKWCIRISFSVFRYYSLKSLGRLVWVTFSIQLFLWIKNTNLTHYSSTHWHLCRYCGRFLAEFDALYWVISLNHWRLPWLTETVIICFHFGVYSRFAVCSSLAQLIFLHWRLPIIPDSTCIKALVFIISPVYIVFNLERCSRSLH